MVVDDLGAIGLTVVTGAGTAASAISAVIPGSPRPYGVISVYATRPRAFRSEDAQFVDALASVLAGAIQRDRTEERFRRFLEAAPDAIIVVDRYGQLVSANAQAEVLFGYRRDELVGASVEMLVPDHVRDIHARHRNEYVGEPRVRPVGAGSGLVARRSDGSEVPVDIMLSPLEVDDDRLVIAAIRDVTERRRVEAVRDSFLHAVSHELRTPLTTVLGFASLLANDLDTLAPAQVHQLATRLLTNAQRLERLLTASSTSTVWRAASSTLAAARPTSSSWSKASSAPSISKTSTSSSRRRPGAGPSSPPSTPRRSSGSSRTSSSTWPATAPRGRRRRYGSARVATVWC